MVQYFNLFYFIGLIFGIAYILGFYFVLRKKSDATKYKVILIMAFAGFALHYIKQLFYWDAAMLRKSTLENICAISTVVLPFMLLAKKKDFFMNEFVLSISIIGGILALLVPTEAIGNNILSFEPIRFYFCHANLAMVGILTGVFGFYRPSLKKLPYFYLGFFVYQLILLGNTAFICYTGLATREGFTATQLFLDSQYLNNSFTFGPTQDMGIASKVFDALIPNFMVYELNGRQNYWPIISLIGPSIFCCLVYFVINWPFLITNKKPNQNLSTSKE